MKLRLPLVLLLLVVAVPLGARDTRKSLDVNLKFLPQEGVDSNSPDLLPAMIEHSVTIRVEDARGGQDALVIGKGTNDDDASFAVMATTDVVAYLRDTLQLVASEWGLKTAGDGDRVLTVRVTRFFVEESNKAVGSMYSAEAKLAFALADSAGTKLAEGAVSGEAHRYGRARSAENCNEVLSDALKEAIANALSDSRLQTAWTTGKSSGGASAGAGQESVEARLKKLDELLEKGLISKEEHARKRAEILKDL